MATGWKKLTRKDLTTFDKFAKQAVLTAMDLGGVGKIGTNGHAQIRGRDKASLTIGRDTSAPHCEDNVMADLKRAFPELRTNGATKEDTMTAKPMNGLTQELVECPAKGCDEKFATLYEANEHVHEGHYICDWAGCDYGPDGGPFVGRTSQSKAGHINVRHKENKFYLASQNPESRELAAIKRAATMASKAKAKATLNGGTPPVTPAESNGHRTAVPPSVEVARQVEKEAAEIRTAVPTDGDAEAALVLIRELLASFFGEDPEEVATLKKELAAAKANLARVREAVGLDFGDDDDK